jgi:hypothetical protein
VEDHRGHVAMRNRDGEGARVVLELPHAG